FSEPRLDDLLAQIVRVAAPVVLQAFGGQSTTPAAGTPASAAPLGGLLDAIVRALPGLLGQLTGGGAQVAHQQSLLAPVGGAGRRGGRSDAAGHVLLARRRRRAAGRGPRGRGLRRRAGSDLPGR